MRLFLHWWTYLQDFHGLPGQRKCRRTSLTIWFSWMRCLKFLDARSWQKPLCKNLHTISKSHKLSMFVLFCIHTRVESCLALGPPSSAGEHLWPASFCDLDGIQASGRLKSQGNVEEFQEQMFHDVSICFNIILHRKDQKGASASRATPPRVTSILGHKSTLLDSSTVVFCWQSQSRLLILVQTRPKKQVRNALHSSWFFEFGIRSSIWKTQRRERTATPFEWPAWKSQNPNEPDRSAIRIRWSRWGRRPEGVALITWAIKPSKPTFSLLAPKQV